MALWKVLRNRHVVIALLVTPLLSVGAWFLVGYWVAGDVLTPQPAAAGASYPLVERSGCRYASGRCVLANGDMELELALPLGSASVSAIGSVPLDGVWIGVSGAKQTPPVMAAHEGEGLRWRVTLPTVPSAGDRLRVAVSRGGSRFFGEASLQFQASSD